MKIDFRNALLCVAVLVLFAQCTSDVDANLEDAKFALDDQDYASAISSAAKALNEEPDNVEAARILSSAYMGRGGFNMHEIAVQLLNLEEKDNNSYQFLSTALPDDGDLDDMKSAIETLQSLTGIDEATLETDELKDAAYDLGLAEMIYHYAIALYHTNYKSDPDNFDVLLLDDDSADDDFDDLAQATSALVKFDNHLQAAGLDPNADNGSFINEARQTHCMLQGISTDEGYDLATFQAFVLCNLSEDSASETPSGFNPDFTDCSLTNPDEAGLPDVVTDCFGTDTVVE